MDSPAAEPPPWSERLLHVVGRPRTAAVLLGVVLSWVALDVVLARLSLPRIDPFPCLWLQRFTLVFNLTLLLICARAGRSRSQRLDAQTLAAHRSAREDSAPGSLDVH